MGFNAAGSKGSLSYCYGHAGKDGHYWRGARRSDLAFVTTSWATVELWNNEAVWARNAEGDPSSSLKAAELRAMPLNEWFAGVVCAWAD